MMSLKNGFKGDPDFSKNNTFKINWSHTADMKARPGVTFNAFVNAGSSKFNSQVPNSPTTNFNNTLNSSISYSKVWKDKPFNFQVSANHDQNTNLNLINFRFPDANFSVNTLYPFRKKEGVGEALFEAVEDVVTVADGVGEGDDNVTLALNSLISLEDNDRL
jgi:hypothetical protein